jgi:hypothetical protein
MNNSLSQDASASNSVIENSANEDEEYPGNIMINIFLI